MRDIRSLTKNETITLLVGALTIGVLLFGELRVATTFRHTQAWKDLGWDAETGARRSHLRLEEHLAGDDTVELEAEVVGRLSTADAACRVLSNGGRVDGTEVPPLPVAHGDLTVRRLCAQLRELRRLTLQRHAVGPAAEAGSPLDVRYDRVFEEVEDLAEETRARVDVVVDAALRRLLAMATAAAGLLAAAWIGAVVITGRSRRRLERLAERYRATREAAFDAIVGVDAAGRLVAANRAATTLTGLSPGELEGRVLHDLMHHPDADGQAHPRHLCPVHLSLADGRPRAVLDDVIRRRDGVAVPVEWSLTPTVERGRVVGATVVLRDVSRWVQTEQTLLESERRLTEAEEVASLGSWHWELTTGEVWWSPGLYAVTGLDAQQVQASFDVWLSSIHPDDRDPVVATLSRALEEDDGYTLDYRLVRPDGVVRDARALGVLTRDGDGRAIRGMGTVQDVTEQRAAERAKSEFTSVISHELRTPLSSIHGALALMRAGAVGELSERGARMVDIAASNTERLVRLINDILDIERLESGRLELHRETCDLGVLIEQAGEVMQPMAGEAGMTILIEGRSARIDADADRLVQVLTNLLSNAIKFSPRGATITLTAEPGPAEVLVRVADQGRGIPQDQLERIFGRFQQVDSSDRRDGHGTGLGLAICRSIVEQHGGRIWAESDGHHGSTVAFTMPVATDGPEPIVHDPCPSDGEFDPTAAPHAATLVLCDDDAASRSWVAAALRSQGMTVLEASTGEQAIELSTTYAPDAIIMDLVMPRTDGWRATAALKDEPTTEDIPVIILTAVAGAEDHLLGHSVAASIAKRSTPSELVAAVEAALGRSVGRPRVLVVEDDEELAGVLDATLTHHGLQAEHVQTGQAAIRRCLQRPPDLVVLDLGLPDMNGFAFLDWLRQQDELSLTPVLVYTASDLSTADRLRLARIPALTKGQTDPGQVGHRVLEMLGRTPPRDGDGSPSQEKISNGASQ